MSDHLKGRRAIVTGASRGIGAAIAADLARNGAAVCLVARDQGALRARAEGLAEAGRTATTFAIDLNGADAAVQVVAHAAETLGGVDILVNCAGDTRRGDFFTLTDEDWAGGFGLKFFGAMRLCRAAWSHLAAGSGAVVNVVGIGSRTPSAEFTIGGAVNSALLNFTKALAEIGQSDGVRVNAINPGWVATDRLKTKIGLIAKADGIDEEQARRKLIQSAGVRRLGEPQDIADLVTFLVSDKAAYIQGCVIDIDGGATRGL